VRVLVQVVVAGSDGRRGGTRLRDEGNVDGVEQGVAGCVLRLLSGDERYIIVSMSARGVLLAICSFAISSFRPVEVIATRRKVWSHFQACKTQGGMYSHMMAACRGARRCGVVGALATVFRIQCGSAKLCAKRASLAPSARDPANISS
jgi:hypothetical protein